MRIEPKAAMSPSASATLALCRLEWDAAINVIEAHLTGRKGFDGEAIEALGNRIARHGHMLQRGDAHE